MYLFFLFLSFFPCVGGLWVVIFSYFFLIFFFFSHVLVFFFTLKLL